VCVGKEFVVFLTKYTIIPLFYIFHNAMATKYDMYDTAFLGILQNEGNIETFLDAVFSFLYRR